MATRNPYDRRDPPAQHDFLMLDGAVGDIYSDGRRAYPGFSLSRLEELLRDEFARGYNYGEGTLERRVEEEILPKAKREAWDNGRRAGHEDGWQALLQEIAQQWEDAINSTLERLEVALGGDDVPFGTVLTATRDAHKLLLALRHAHHQGFRELPF